YCRRANGTCCLKDPSNATGRGIERLNQATRTADENLSIENGGLRKGDDVAVEAVGPFQLKPRDVAKTDAGHVGGLKARVGGSRTPTVPLRLSTAGEFHCAI